MNRCLCCMREIPEENPQRCPHCHGPSAGAQRSLLDLKPGTLLNERRYLIGQALGSGGFGITYIAWDQRLGGRRAVKEFFPKNICIRGDNGIGVVLAEVTHRPTFVHLMQRFEEEAQRLESLRNAPSIVLITDYFEENNTAYLVMDYLDGCNLSEYLRRCNGRLNQKEAADIIMAALAALQEAHAQGILHRDISADNIYRTNAGKIRLIDFGSARYEAAQKAKVLTHFEKGVYTAPEQRRDDRQGPYTDLYAMGVCLYKLITGDLPSFDNNSSLILPKEHARDWPAWLRAALVKAMQPEPANRFQTAKDFYLALTAKKKTPRGLAAALIGAVTVLLAVIFILFSKPVGPPQENPTNQPSPGMITSAPVQPSAQASTIEPPANSMPNAEPSTIPPSPEPTPPPTPTSAPTDTPTDTPAPNITETAAPDVTDNLSTVSKSNGTPAPTPSDILGSLPEAIDLNPENTILPFKGPDVAVEYVQGLDVVKVTQRNGVLQAELLRTGTGQYKFTCRNQEKFVRITVTDSISKLAADKMFLTVNKEADLLWTTTKGWEIAADFKVDQEHQDDFSIVSIKNGLKITALRAGVSATLTINSSDSNQTFTVELHVWDNLAGKPDVPSAIYLEHPQSITLSGASGMDILAEAYVNDPAVLSASITGNQLEIRPLKPGRTKLTIMDSSAKYICDITVRAVLKALEETNLAIAVGSKATVGLITNGTLPEDDIELDFDSSLLSVATHADYLEITALKAGSGTVAVTDSFARESRNPLVLNCTVVPSLSDIPSEISLTAGSVYEFPFSGDTAAGLSFGHADGQDVASLRMDGGKLTVNATGAGDGTYKAYNAATSQTIRIHVTDKITGLAALPPGGETGWQQPIQNLIMEDGSVKELSMEPGQQQKLIWSTYFGTFIDARAVISDPAIAMFQIEQGTNALTVTSSPSANGKRTSLTLTYGSQTFEIPLSVIHQTAQIDFSSLPESLILYGKASIKLPLAYTADAAVELSAEPVEGDPNAAFDIKDGMLTVAPLRSGSVRYDLSDGHKNHVMTVEVKDTVRELNPGELLLAAGGTAKEISWDTIFGTALLLSDPNMPDGLTFTNTGNSAIVRSIDAVGQYTLYLSDGHASHPVSVRVCDRLLNIQLPGDQAMLLEEENGKVNLSVSLSAQALSNKDLVIRLATAFGDPGSLLIEPFDPNLSFDLSAGAGTDDTYQSIWESTGSAATEKWSELALHSLLPGLTKLRIRDGDSDIELILTVRDALVSEPVIPEEIYMDQDASIAMESIYGTLAADFNQYDGSLMDISYADGQLIIHPKNTGSTTLHVTVGEWNKDFPITVKPVLASLDPGEISMTEGNTQTVHWTAHGTMSAADLKPVYDPTLVNVEIQQGEILITALSAGTGIIQISDEMALEGKKQPTDLKYTVEKWIIDAGHTAGGTVTVMQIEEALNKVVTNIPFKPDDIWDDTTSQVVLAFKAQYGLEGVPSLDKAELAKLMDAAAEKAMPAATSSPVSSDVPLTDLKPRCAFLYNGKLLVLNDSDRRIYVYAQEDSGTYRNSEQYSADSGLHFIDLQSADGVLWALDDAGQLYIWDGKEAQFTTDAVPALPSKASIAFGSYGLEISQASFGKDAAVLLFGDGDESIFTFMYKDKPAELPIARGNVLSWTLGGAEGPIPLCTDGNLTRGKLLTNVARIAMGQGAAAAINAEGKLYLWGNLSQELLKGVNLSTAVPYAKAISIKLNNKAVKKPAFNTDVLCVSPYNVMAVMADGAFIMAGDNSQGQLGQGTADPVKGFVKPAEINGTVIKCSCSGSAIFALTNDGSLYAWGEGRSTPSVLATGVKDFSVSDGNTCVLIYSNNEIGLAKNGIVTPIR